TRCQKEDANISVPCLSATTVPTGSWLLSRHWFFGQGLGESLCEVSKTESSHLFVCKSAGENKRQVGTRNHPGRHEALPVTQTRTGRPSQIHRMDTRQPIASAGLPGAAN